jgi:hypothetical protein
MLAASPASLIAFKYSVSSGDHADGPAVLDVGLGEADCAPEELEHDVSARLRLASSAIAAVFEFFESIFNTL